MQASQSHAVLLGRPPPIHRLVHLISFQKRFGGHEGPGMNVKWQLPTNCKANFRYSQVSRGQLSKRYALVQVQFLVVDDRFAPLAACAIAVSSLDSIDQFQVVQRIHG